MTWIDSETNRSTFLKMLSPASGEKILDVGAGKGRIASLVQDIGKCEVHALDPDKRRIAYVGKRYPNLKCCLSPSDRIPYPDGFFDKAYSTMAVHHFPDQRRSVGELSRVLKPGGPLVVVDITPRNLVGRLARFFENGVMRAGLNFLDVEGLSEILGQEGNFEVRETARNASVYMVLASRA